MKSKGSMAAFLAGAAMVGFLTVFAALWFKDVPAANKDFFNMGFIALIGCVSTAFGYFLGSSQGSAHKNDMIAAVAPPPAGEIVRPDHEAGFSRLALLPPLLLLALAVAACAGLRGDPPEAVAARNLLSARQGIIAAATTVDALCAQATLSQADCDRAAETYRRAQAAYHTASSALLVAIERRDPNAWQTYRGEESALLTFFRDLDALAGGAR